LAGQTVSRRAASPAIDAAPRPRTLLGVTIALAAAAAFAVANTSASVAYQSGSNALTIAATRFVLPAVALVAWLRISGIPLLLTPRNGLAAASLGVLTAFYNWALLRSFGSIPFAVAVLIFYLFPLIAAAMVAGLGWEKLTWRTIAAGVVAFVGLALALDVRGGNLDVSGVALAFLAAFGIAVVVAISGRIFRKVDARPLTLYMAATASVLLLLLCSVNGDFMWPKTPAGWTGFAAAAVLYGFAMIAFFIAVSIIGPVRASLLSYADAVISAALGVIVLGQALTPVQILGIAIVVLALIGATTRPRPPTASSAGAP
jgi:drug/metabolite transporter (DMT)-like permease